MAQVTAPNRLASPATLLGVGLFVFGALLILVVVFSRRQKQAISPNRFFKGSGSNITLALGIFASLVGSILAVTNLFKPASIMDSAPEMAGMSMDEMMRVDGSANATPVNVEMVKPAALEASVRYTGSVRPYLEVTVYPRVEGRLTDYSAYPGNRVVSGQVLARLSAAERTSDLEATKADTEAAQAELTSTRAELEEHHQEVEQMTAQYSYWQGELPRAQVLLDKGVISQEEFDKEKSEALAARATLRGVQLRLGKLRAQVLKAQAMVAQARAKNRNAQIMQSYTVITSPITGIVQERMVDPGVVVQPGMGILKVGDYSRVRLQANVAAQDLSGVRIGSPIVARLTSQAGKLLTGRVTSIFPKAGEETRTVTVEALVNNPGTQLLAGQFLEMSLVTGRKSNALSISKTALTQFEGKPAVWVMAGKFAQRKLITTGLASNERIEVTSGLQSGDAVIASGQEKLAENTKVVAVDDAGQPVASLGGNSSAGDAQVMLVSPKDKAVMGDNQLILEVRDPKSGQLLPVRQLDVNVAMPMKNASPMAADVEVKAAKEPGRFQVDTYLGMQGTWEVTAKVKDKDHQGISSFTVDNRQEKP